MAKPMTIPASSRRAADLFGWVTQGAFVLALSLVLARGMMVEMLRDPFQVMPGAAAAPAAPGPGTALVLDAACCVPALLILIRRVLDRRYSLRWAWSFAALIPLCAWMLLSVRWADDRFAAMVYACQFIAAAAMLWALAQLVCGWRRLRIVAGLCYGLLLVYVAQGLMYEMIDVPEMRQNWDEKKDEILREHGWQPGSFTARQFEKNVTGGEMVGFDVSPNSFAAAIVLLTVIAAGAALQRWQDGNERVWAALLAGAVPLAGLVIWFTGCRAAYATPILAALLVAAAWRLAPWLRKNAGRAYAIVVCLLCLGTALLVHHGIRHGTLFHDSLTFRWKYWVGSWRMYFKHPWIGVGWANFGPHYLATRLPEAAEEIRDPHNFLLRFFLELGAVGGALALAWIARLWWEWTVLNENAEGRDGTEPDAAAESSDAGPRREPSPGDRTEFDAQQRRPKAASASAGFTDRDKTRGSDIERFRASEDVFGASALPGLLAIVAAALAINTAASVDFQQRWEFTTVEILKRLLFACALLIGAFGVALRSTRRADLDDRPAPWMYLAIVVSIGVYMVHNLIEFAFFETGPMFLFALLAGSALGLRLPPTPARRPTWISAAVLAGALAACVVGIAFVAAPTITAERLAADAALGVMGDVLADGQTRVPTPASLDRAVEEYSAAFAAQPLNADYAYQAGRAMSLRGDSPAEILNMISAAIAADPSKVDYYRTRAQIELRDRDLQAALDDLKTATALDPNNVDAHIAYGDALADAGNAPDARKEYQTALHKDDLLDAAEPKRMTKDQRETIEEKVAKLW